MPKTHPHAEATYRVIPLEDGSFGVEVSIPENYPTTVKPFGTEADAEAWITGHRERVQWKIRRAAGSPGLPATVAARSDVEGRLRAMSRGDGAIRLAFHRPLPR